MSRIVTRPPSVSAAILAAFRKQPDATDTEIANSVGCGKRSVGQARKSWRRGDIRICARCGQEFLSYHKDAVHRFCSLSCGGGEPRRPLICEICGNPFIPHRPTRGEPDQRTCSRECGTWINGSTKLGAVCVVVWQTCPCGNIYRRSGTATPCPRCVLLQRLVRTLRREELRIIRTTPRPCANCGTDFTQNTRGHLAIYCKDPVCVRAVRKVGKYRRKDALARSGIQSRIKWDSANPTSLLSIGDRDGWRCHICLGIVRKPKLGDVNNDRYAPSVDHIIPLDSLRDPAPEVLTWIEHYGGLHVPENLRLAHKGCNSGRHVRGPGQLLLVG